jgi:hypothetical protein
MIRIRFDDGTEFDTDGRVLHHDAARNPYHTLKTPVPGTTFERIVVFLPDAPPAALAAKAGPQKEVTITWERGSRTLRNVQTGWQRNPSIFWVEETPKFG